jgi:hypothetical protein
MFGCCRYREKVLKQFIFENGTTVLAYDLEDAKNELRKIVKNQDVKRSWNAYLDLLSTYGEK